MKSNLESIIEGVNLFNQLAPAAAGLILSLRHTDGTETVLTQLDTMEAKVDADVAEWDKLIEQVKAEQQTG